MTWLVRASRGIARLPVLALVAVLTFYRRFISPLYPPSCKYYPSCSSYALTSVRRHGAVRGSWLALRRLSRCHPWALGGVDDVPPARDRHTHVHAIGHGRDTEHTHVRSAA